MKYTWTKKKSSTLLAALAIHARAPRGRMVRQQQMGVAAAAAAMIL
jgi:hypothetical protein